MNAFDTRLMQMGYTEFPNDLFGPGRTVGSHPYAFEIQDMLSADRGISASTVFCVEEQPAICIIDATTISKMPGERVEQIRQRLWNQSLATVVLIFEPGAVAAYSVNQRQANPDTLTAAEAESRGRWSAHEVRSGFIADRHPSWFAPEQRVDQRLLANLRDIVRTLGKHGPTIDQAEALMAQVIFLCYLEQRGIVGQAYRNTHKLRPLKYLIDSCDGVGVERLLYQLRKDFNGDFLSSDPGGAPSWRSINNASFSCIRDFLEGVDIETGQGALWSYDFSHIPVELISAIYETLLKDRQGALGAYYTPRHLANLVVDQALENIPDVMSCTIYDGASGSGILLTTAFRRILRHAEVHQGRKLRLAERVELMRRTIFGSDIDETACWITAFSLYLSLLEGLAEDDIHLFQTGQYIKLPPLVGSGLNIEKGPRRGEFFSKANPFSESGRFDIFICNPPWGESDADACPAWEAWAREQKPAYPIGKRQIAAGFAYRATQAVGPSGRVTMIMPLSLIVGASAQSVEFRRRWLQDVAIERVINLGDVRRLLFPATKHPCAIVKGRIRARGELVIPPHETVDYWTPKTDISLALGRLALHTIDQKSIATRDIYDRPQVLIANYWGDQRDSDLVSRLRRMGTLRDVLTPSHGDWIDGKGFHAPNDSNPPRDLGILNSLAFLPAEDLPKYCPFVPARWRLGTVRDRFDCVASPGGKRGRLYKGPRVLFTDGLSEDYSVRASFSQRPFAFQSSVGAIGGPPKDADLLKFLAAYLRSPLCCYLVILSSYSVIGERPRIAVDDLKAFPFCRPESHPDPARAHSIVEQVATLFDEWANEVNPDSDGSNLSLKDRLDELVYDYFALSDTDRVIVSETAKFIAPSIQPADYEGISTPLLARPKPDEVESYVDALSGELMRWRDTHRGHGALSVTAAVDGVEGFLGAVRIATTTGDSIVKKSSASRQLFETFLADVTSGLNLHLDKHDRSELFRVPNIMVIANDAFYFVKPLRRRFWLTRAALADADCIVRTVQAVRWSKSGR